MQTGIVYLSLSLHSSINTRLLVHKNQILILHSVPPHSCAHSCCTSDDASILLRRPFSCKVLKNIFLEVLPPYFSMMR